METGALGKVYQCNEVIIRQGEAGDSMYVVQDGKVAVTIEQNGHEMPLTVLGPGEFFGEEAIFERLAHSATVTALGEARVLTVDRRNLFRRIAEDPTLAFNLAEQMSARIRALTNEIARLSSNPESQHAAGGLSTGSWRLDLLTGPGGPPAWTERQRSRRRRERAGSLPDHGRVAETEDPMAAIQLSALRSRR